MPCLSISVSQPRFHCYRRLFPVRRPCRFRSAAGSTARVHRVRTTTAPDATGSLLLRPTASPGLRNQEHPRSSLPCSRSPQALRHTAHHVCLQASVESSTQSGVAGSPPVQTRHLERAECPSLLSQQSCHLRMEFWRVYNPYQVVGKVMLYFSVFLCKNVS